MADTLILAVDIERTGATTSHHTIAIGASLVDSDYNELSCLFLAAWSDAECAFEESCWTEFWSKHPRVLKRIKDHAKQTCFQIINSTDNITPCFEKQEEHMIREFIHYVKKIQTEADEQKKKVIIVTDNACFDFHWISTLISKHCPSHYPLPYKFHNNAYGKVRDMSDMRYGMMLAIDKEATLQGMKWDKLIVKHNIKLPEAFVLATKLKQHDHLPHHDAYTIAIKMKMLLQLNVNFQ